MKEFSQKKFPKILKTNLTRDHENIVIGSRFSGISPFTIETISLKFVSNEFKVVVEMTKEMIQIIIDNIIENYSNVSEGLFIYFSLFI